MQRFSFSHLSLGKDLSISEVSFIHQISRVLRSDIGENIVLFNGDGREYVYTIRSITKKEIDLSFEREYAGNGDSEIFVRLYQALPNKYEKIEYILQKGVEVGIREFIFFPSQRSQRLVINERKIERFQEIVREATEQCSGNRVASITFLDMGIPIPEVGASYVFHTEGNESKNIRDIETKLGPINIFVGPEGGWSPSEIACFRERNTQCIHLGGRILRTETTGPVVAFFLIMK